MPAFKRRYSSGFTLIELLLAISISLLITVGVFRAYKSIDRDTKVKETTDLLETIFSQASRITAQSSDYTIAQAGGGSATLNATILLDNVGNNADATVSLYPIGTTVGAGKIYHPFDGEALLSTDSSLGSANDLLAVKLQNIPRQACLALLQRMSTNGVYDMWVDSAGDDRLVALGPAALPIAPGRNNVVIAKVAPICNRSDTLTLTFRKLKPLDLASMRRVQFGATLSAEEIARIQPLYNRQESAMAAREDAQIAL